jgi:hypothetical protein
MSEIVICMFRVRAGCEDEFRTLQVEHMETLRELELITDRPVEAFIGSERTFDGGAEGPFVVKIFEWVDADAAGRAHLHPRVSDLWERMEPLCEARGGRPAMEFPHFRPFELV